MRHDELLAKIKGSSPHWLALRAVVELHKPDYGDFPDEDAICLLCSKEREYVISYPCQTIKAIELNLQ